MQIEIVGVTGNAARVNLTLKTESHNCLYGSWSTGKPVERQMVTESLVPSVESDRFLRLLPKYRTPTSAQWDLFESDEIWLVKCFDARYAFTPYN